ncbi:hypothetical protein [Rhizobium lentis]|uniref:hypothetical protein n=1 Tax=Rhizobium lentis TaxID=1138194 RepID=UPI001C83E02E|nr:hypothetical protein [Rhizobium lentis]MBX5014955.1 hypothetical protein [Rhizobium lentis]
MKIIHFIDDQLAGLKRLIVDLEKLEADLSDLTELKGSRALYRCVPSFRAASCVKGRVVANADRPSGARIKTSQTFAVVLGEDHSCERTLEKWCRLGTEGMR